MLSRGLVLLACAVQLFAVTAAPCKCAVAPPTNAIDAFDLYDAMQWGTVTKKTVNQAKGVTEYSVDIDMNLKGCHLFKTSTVTVDIKTDCDEIDFEVGKAYLFSGTRVKPATNLRMSTSICNFNRGRDDRSISGDQKMWLADQTYNCPDAKPNWRCSNGSKLYSCFTAQVCKKDTWPAGMGIKSCSVNRCNGCTPLYWSGDKAGQGKIIRSFPTNCPRCKENACPETTSAYYAAEFEAATKTLLKEGCPAEEVARARHCRVFPCESCRPVWTDGNGDEVCSKLSFNKVCQDTSFIGYGKSQVTKIGNPLRFGVCIKDLQGKSDYGMSAFLPQTVEECNQNCRCSDMSNVVFNTDPKCPSETIGFGVVGTLCQEIKGCKATAGKVGARLWPNIVNCRKNCESLDLKALTPLLRASAIPDRAGQLPSSGAPATGTQTNRCPADKPMVQCVVSPCAVARPPICPESLGKTLQCAEDYCGGCNALWFLDGLPFSCPKQPSCKAGSAGCCAGPTAGADGVKTIDCAALGLACPTITFPNLPVQPTCKLDGCDGCAPRYYDKNNVLIPDYELRGGVRPSGVAPGLPRPPVWIDQAGGQTQRKCDPRDTQNCCPTGLAPVTCDPEFEKVVCSTMRCDGTTVTTANCRLDPCNGCLAIAWDSKNQFIDVPNKCRPHPCPAITCPNITPRCDGQNIPAECKAPGGPKELSCRMQECYCTSMWFDSATDAPAKCVPLTWKPPCQKDCPAKAFCPPLPPGADPTLMECVAEECTCRGIWKPICKTCATKPTSCPPPPEGFFDPKLELECVAMPCTCEPVQVPKGCKMPNMCPEPKCDALLADPKLTEADKARLLCGFKPCTCEPSLFLNPNVPPPPPDIKNQLAMQTIAAGCVDDVSGAFKGVFQMTCPELFKLDLSACPTGAKCPLPGITADATAFYKKSQDCNFALDAAVQIADLCPLSCKLCTPAPAAPGAPTGPTTKPAGPTTKPAGPTTKPAAGGR